MLQASSAILEFLHLRDPLRAVVSLAAEFQIPRVVPQILQARPHDQSLFTQGLVYCDGFLFESSGMYGRSSLRKISLTDDSIVKARMLEGGLFAEGIAIWGKALYQLTWKSRKAIVYDLMDLSPLREVTYSGEGWGLAATPIGLVMSDGSSLLTFRNENFEVLKTLRVTSHHIPLRHINDLEWAGGKIYANVYHSTNVLEIDCETGRLTRIIDCSVLARLEQADDSAHVLNGIAYCPERNTFFLTGKCWKHLFEIHIPK